MINGHGNTVVPPRDKQSTTQRVLDSNEIGHEQTNISLENVKSLNDI